MSGALRWYTVGCYELDGTVDIDAVVEELELYGDVLDVDKENGHITLSLDEPFLSTAKNMNELKGDARRAMPQTQGCKRPVEIINVTRKLDMRVFEF
ncbi:hypothetical protein SEA_KASHFLOW_194 [Mycobacterium phage KashFlow]|nr:hypothetical protein SEA_KASHFLOW_194 [Mycobacterium phage KashFlow]